MARKKTPYTHIDNSTLELFMQSLQEQFNTDQLTPCLIAGYKHSGKFFIRVVRYITNTKKETIISVEADNFIMAFDAAIAMYRKIVTDMNAMSPTQQFLNFK